jgi:long-chain acyl-CoA synthetase
MGSSSAYYMDFHNFADVFKYTDKYIFGTKTFISGKNDQKITYSELLKITSKMAGWFKKNNLKINDRVLIISHDDFAVTLLFMACLRYGLTAVILSPESTDQELENLIKAAKASAVFADENILEQISDKISDLTPLPISRNANYTSKGMLSRLIGKNKTSDNSFPGVLEQLEQTDEIDQQKISDDTVAYILFTSGTTSHPKGVEITHRNLLSQLKTFISQYGYTQHSNILNILPLHHTDGLTQGPVVAFTASASVHRPMQFKIDRLQELLDIYLYRCHITHMIAVPSMLQLIDALDDQKNDYFKTDKFEFIISTAGYLDPNLWERFENRFGVKIVNVYGLTETVCEALYCGPDEATRKLGTIGKPVDTEARIVDEDGKDVKQGQTGELWLKGEHIMKGYFEMPEETAEVLTNDGWFKTGDLCKIDEDGFYQIVGRKKNLIIVGGINIYPDDVANVLRSLGGVLDAVAWGEPDDTWGEVVVAAIIPEQQTTPDTKLLSEEFLKLGSLEKLPRQIHVVESFPRGPAGKVIIRELQEQIAKTGAAVKDNEEQGSSIEAHIIKVASNAFKCPEDEINLQSTAETTKGWNSLAHVEFLLSLEKEFKIKMDPKDILRVRSIADAMDIVVTKTNKAA